MQYERSILSWREDGQNMKQRMPHAHTRRIRLTTPHHTRQRALGSVAISQLLKDSTGAPLLLKKSL